MKTDSIFYRLFQIFPNILFELIELPPEQANLYRFSSVEVKQLAFRIDGVFLPNVDTPEQPIYFVEVQFQPDKKFYSRFFSEMFLYLDRTELTNDWYGVIIFPTRSIDKGETRRYRALLASEQVTRIYLDELQSKSDQSIGIEAIKLVISSEDETGEQAKQVIAKASQQITDDVARSEIIELIETIVIYKLPGKSREEIAAMLGLGDLKQTKFYQEAKQEGKLEGKQEGKQEAKLEAVTRFLAMGLSVEQIATGLDLDVEEVRKIAQQQSSEQK